MQKTRERYTTSERDLIEQLDAVIDRVHFRDDVLDEPTITRPLPDKVTVRTFTTHQAAPPDPDLSTRTAPTAQINTIDPTRYTRLVKCRDCFLLDITAQGTYCLMQGDIALPDVVGECETFTIATACA